MFACVYGSADAVRFLLDHAANVDYCLKVKDILLYTLNNNLIQSHSL